MAKEFVTGHKTSTVVIDGPWQNSRLADDGIQHDPECKFPRRNEPISFFPGPGSFRDGEPIAAFWLQVNDK